MSDVYDITRSSDLHGLNLERVTFLAGLMDSAPVLPFLYAVATKALQADIYPIETPGPHTRKTSEGIAANPRQLKKGQSVTLTKVTLANALSLSRLAQIGMDGSINDLMLQQALGNAAGWGVHQECIDYLMNDAYTVNWADGVPFFSASHPSEIGLQSNRLESAFDNTALKAALVMLSKTRGHDGQYVAQMGGYILAPPDLGPTIYETINPGGMTLPTAGAAAVVSGTFVGAQGLQAVASPMIEDTDAWAVFGRNFKLNAYVADPSAPKIEPIVGTRDRVASDELTFMLGAFSFRGSIGCGAA